MNTDLPLWLVIFGDVCIFIGGYFFGKTIQWLKDRNISIASRTFLEKNRGRK